MHKRLIYLFILMLLLPISIAETQIFSGKVITDTDKVIDGNTFRFTYEETSNKVFVQTPTQNLIVENGKCKSNDVFKVCINSANFSYKNITTYVYYYEISTTIYKLTGSLSAGSKAALSNLLQMESTELTVTISNPTDFDITNIVFNYGLEPFSAVEVKGCELNDNQMQWNGSLKSKYDKTCTAIISADKEGKYSLSGNLSYFNGFETEKKATDALAITVLPKQLKVSKFIDNNTEIKKPFYLNISLQNIHTSEDITGLSTITLPSHVSLIKDAPVFEKDSRVLKLSFALKPGAGINYSLYLEKLSEGKEPINSKFVYTIKGINDVIENSTFVDVVSAQPASQPAETKKEKSNQTINLTSISEAQITQKTSENKTNESKLEAGNKTTEQVTITAFQEPKKFNKNILLIIVVFIVFIIVVLLVFKMRKGKKKEDEIMENLKEEIKDEEIK